MTPETKICTRCRGSGMTAFHVVYAGALGTCFKCAGAGRVYRDKFFREFGYSKQYYGVTWKIYWNRDNPNNGVFKSISLEPLEDATQLNESASAVPITEDQARAFWLKYGRQVRVSDYKPEQL